MINFEKWTCALVASAISLSTVTLLSAAGDPADSLPPCGISIKLKTGMSKKAVKKHLGLPYRTEMSICGSQTTRPWQCELWHYQCRDSRYSTLRGDITIYFDENSVNSWY